MSKLPIWRRFHLRVAVLYASLVFALIGVMGLTVYQEMMAYRVRALQVRLRMAATVLAQQVPSSAVVALNVPDDKGKPEYGNLVRMFAGLAAVEPEFVSIYVLRPTDDASQFQFVADYTAPGRSPPAEVGERYDVRQTGRMRQGLLRPTTEDSITDDKWGRVLSGYAPVIDSSAKTVAVLGVDVAADDLESLRDDVLRLTLTACGVAAAFMLLLAWGVSERVRQPLEKVVEATNLIAMGRFDTRVDLHRNDEFAVLGQRLNDMAKGLSERDFIRSTFGQFVSHDVARRVLASVDGRTLGGDERMITMLLADLVGYSTLSEAMAPAEVVQMLNAYFDLMLAVIERHRGCIVEFTGDGFLCVFGAPDAMADHAERAVRCALEMQASLVAARRVGDEGSDPDRGVSQLQMRIGIHTGTVIAGNIGTPTRMKYSVIGDAVNVTARMEQLNKTLSTSTLFTGETYEQLPVDLRRHAVFRGMHPLKGRTSSVEAYAV